MSKFNFNDYQKVIEKAQNGGSNAVKVGFFKLKDDGDEALVRINCSKLEDLEFATVHTVQADGKWMRISCLNPLGSYGDNCPLCTAQAAGNASISKASKKVYVQMLCAYKDKTTGQFSEAVPVIWERPASFSKDIANKLRDFGNLREVVLKITRNGKAGDMKTTYDLGFVPVYNKPELVSSDFGAFTNFNIAKHSYWEKSVDELNAFLATGAFPESAAKTTASTAAPVQNVAPAATPVAEAKAEPKVEVAEPAPAPAPAPVQTSVPQDTTQERPVRDFKGFSF